MKYLHASIGVFGCWFIVSCCRIHRTEYRFDDEFDGGKSRRGLFCGISLTLPGQAGRHVKPRPTCGVERLPGINMRKHKFDKCDRSKVISEVEQGVAVKLAQVGSCRKFL